MSRKEIISTIRTLSRRSLHGRRFLQAFRHVVWADATAWAILALKASGGDTAVLASARSRLGVINIVMVGLCMAKEQPHDVLADGFGHHGMVWQTRNCAENIMKACDF